VATSQAYADSSIPLKTWRHKLAVIPIGTPAPEPADPERVARLRHRHGGRRIVFALGRMTHYKGWQVLMRAARHLDPDVQVVIGGGGPELARFRAMAERLQVQDRVELVGPVSPARLEAYFAIAELFCMPSTNRAEAYGVAALEAMARGLPVVASAIPGSGLGWLLQDGITGLQVPPGEPRALAQALRSLLDDGALRERLGRAGRARWAAYFTAETMADETVALYHRLLAARGGPPPTPPTPTT
jgi:glycosyltransferase involved in cell wall biosynthesis